MALVATNKAWCNEDPGLWFCQQVQQVLNMKSPRALLVPRRGTLHRPGLAGVSPLSLLTASVLHSALLPALPAWPLPLYSTRRPSLSLHSSHLHKEGGTKGSGPDLTPRTRTKPPRVNCSCTETASTLGDSPPHRHGVAASQHCCSWCTKTVSMGRG